MKLERSNLSTELQLFCPRRTCLCYQSLDNKIIKGGTYTTKNDNIARQMFYCDGGQHRFSEIRFWVSFELGSRTTFTATKLVKKINQYFNLSLLKNPFKITTDKLAAYKNSIESVLGNSHYVYLQILSQKFTSSGCRTKNLAVKQKVEPPGTRNGDGSHSGSINMALLFLVPIRVTH